MSDQPEKPQPKPTNLKTALRAVGAGSARLAPPGVPPQAVEYLLGTMLHVLREIYAGEDVLAVVGLSDELLAAAEQGGAGNTDERLRRQLPQLRAVLHRARRLVSETDHPVQ